MRVESRRLLSDFVYYVGRFMRCMDEIFDIDNRLRVLRNQAWRCLNMDNPDAQYMDPNDDYYPDSDGGSQRSYRSWREGQWED